MIFKEKNKMNDDKIVGYIVEYYAGKEEKEAITVADLTSDDKKRQDCVKSWAFGLGEPWSDSAISYVINRDWRQDVPEDEIWTAQCNSIFYDSLESVAIAKGPTPQEALKNVEELVEYVVKNFYEYDDEDEE